jgi:tRNA-2-methylthio-N6-dimethylallyladenosine synthase
MTEELISEFGKLKTLCEAIHIPVQSGSNRILKKMGRRYTRENFLHTVKKLKENCPDIAISTDLIIGYPDETEEDFMQTISLIDEAGFSGAFSFKYSPRPQTPAARRVDNVSPEEKSRRLKLVHDVILKNSSTFTQALLGKELEVLVEGRGRMERQLTGRARNFQIVNFVPDEDKPLDSYMGKLVKVKITGINPNSLEGRHIK